MDWINTADKMPEEFDPVFLSRNRDEDLGKSDIGYLISNDEGLQGWHIGNERFLKIHARSFWMLLEERNNFVPAHLSGEGLTPVLDFYLERLDFFDKKIMYLGKWMIHSGQGIYHLDYYISGILNRGMSLIYGFITLIRSVNFISAAHLVRPYLDNYLRLSAAWMVEKPHDFAFNVLKGGGLT